MRRVVARRVVERCSVVERRRTVVSVQLRLHSLKEQDDLLSLSGGLNEGVR